jgi:hypothetical protein
MFTSIMGMIAAITEGFRAFQVASQDIRDFMSWYKKVQTERWVNDLHTTIQDLEKASTPEEKINAAKALQDKIRSL